MSVSAAISSGFSAAPTVLSAIADACYDRIVKPRGAQRVSPDALRAAKLSHVPGVTIAETCERFDVTKAEVTRARKAPASKPSITELALAALTKNGTTKTGAIADLENVAAWIDHVNHDGCTVDEVRILLAALVTFDEARWRFAGTWP